MGGGGGVEAFRGPLGSSLGFSEIRGVYKSLNPKTLKP